MKQSSYFIIETNFKVCIKLNYFLSVKSIYLIEHVTTFFVPTYVAYNFNMFKETYIFATVQKFKISTFNFQLLKNEAVD